MIEDAIKQAVAEATQPLLEQISKMLESFSAPQSASPDTLLTDVQVSEMTNIPVATLRMWRSKAHMIPYVKIGSNIRYRLKDIRTFVSGQTVKVMDDEGRIRG